MKTWKCGIDFVPKQLELTYINTKKKFGDIIKNTITEFIRLIIKRKPILPTVVKYEPGKIHKIGKLYPKIHEVFIKGQCIQDIYTKIEQLAPKLHGINIPIYIFELEKKKEFLFNFYTIISVSYKTDCNSCINIKKEFGNIIKNLITDSIDKEKEDVEFLKKILDYPKKDK
jgi:hypothetical protein